MTGRPGAAFRRAGFSGLRSLRSLRSENPTNPPPAVRLGPADERRPAMRPGDAAEDAGAFEPWLAAAKSGVGKVLRRHGHRRRESRRTWQRIGLDGRSASRKNALRSRDSTPREYTLTKPSNCLTKQDHLSIRDALPPSPLRGFNFGYASTHGLTVMSNGRSPSGELIPGGSGVPYFSNPNLYFPGSQTRMGVPGDERVTGLDGPVNASRSLNEVWDFVAALSDSWLEELLGACNRGDVLADAIASARVVFGPEGGTKKVAFSASSATAECMDDVFLRMGWPRVEVNWVEGGVVPWKTTSGYSVSADEVREGQWRVSLSAAPHFQSCEATKNTVAIAELWDNVQMRSFGRLSHRVPGVRPGFVQLETRSSHSFCKGAPSRHLRRLGDFDGDGRADALLRHADGRWRLYGLDEQVAVAGHPVDRLTQNPVVAVAGVGDFNGDGRDDLLMRHERGSWRYYPMDGQRVGTGSGGVELPDDAWIDGIGDFNRDGKDDVLLRHGDGLWRIHFMDGRTVHESPSSKHSSVDVFTGNTGWVAGVGDFDGDGGEDVLFRRVDGTWHYHPYPFYSAIGTEDYFAGGGEVALPPDLAWATAGVADFSGDGKDDVLLRHADGRWRYYAMDGRTVVEEAAPAELPADPSVWLAGVGDVNGDGKADVVARRAHGSWTVYRMDGGRAVGETTVALASETGWGVLNGGAVAPVETTAPVPTQPLALGRDATLDLSAHFADDQTISYEVQPTDADVVRAIVTGSVLTLMPVQSGRTVVTVIARDPDGNATAQTFAVVVSEDGRDDGAHRGVAGTSNAERGHFRDCVDCPEMVVVPAGSFMMGAPEDEVEGSPDERPVHRVDFAAPFAIGKYEVTVRQWRACEAAGRCDDVVVDGPKSPAILISWDDAQEFLAWLSERSGQEYRLPSEAEWEYAARAGTKTAFHFGQRLSVTEAAFGGSAFFDNLPSDIGSFPANAWGLHDVHGNAAEWTQDCWNADYVGAPTDGGAWETGECENRVLRGGSSLDRRPRELRSASRSAYATFFDGLFAGYFGLRVARAVSPLQALSTPIPTQSLSLGTDATLDLAAHFGNDQTLFYEVRSSDAEEEVVRASVAGGTLMLNPLATGRAEITVLAQDDSGNTATQAFSAEVWLRDCAECPAIVAVPAGTFTMGAPESEYYSDDRERPQRTVSIPAFVAGVFEVTFAEWNACVADDGCDGYPPHDEGWGFGRQPVVNVGWDDAQRYVEWLSLRTGHHYRLLTESEWEYAARAGTETPFHTGETITPQQANFDGLYGYPGDERIHGVSRRQTVPVGSFAPNAFGLHDVHGNVEEWVQDCAIDYDWEGARVDGGAVEPEGCQYRRLQGALGRTMRGKSVRRIVPHDTSYTTRPVSPPSVSAWHGMSWERRA